MKTLRFLFLLASVGIVITACAGKPSTHPKSSLACLHPESGSTTYRIGAGDVLLISVWNNKDLERTATVRPDGMISFPLLNDILAAGLTPMRLQQDMDSSLKQYLTNPQVSVVVQAVNSFTVSVLGEVQKPGQYEMHSGRATVLDALALAGGLTPYANRSDIHVLRKEADGTQELPFHYGRAVSMRPGSADFCVDPGDIVIVP